MLSTALFACSLIAGFLSSPPTQTPATLQKRPLKGIVTEMSRKAGVRILVASALADEVLIDPRKEETTPANLEEQLRVLSSKIPLPGRVVKLLLPKGRQDWTAEELLAYAQAEADLFRQPIPDSKPDVARIFSQPYSPAQAKPAIDALGLLPIYIITVQPGSFAGTWETTYGEMRLEQNGNKVTGYYRTNGGRIEGYVSGNEFHMTWFEQANGTGGFGTFRMDATGMSFAGPWFNNTDTENPAGTWTGRRIKNP